MTDAYHADFRAAVKREIDGLLTENISRGHWRALVWIRSRLERAMK